MSSLEGNASGSREGSSSPASAPAWEPTLSHQTVLFHELLEAAERRASQAEADVAFLVDLAEQLRRAIALLRLHTGAPSPQLEAFVNWAIADLPSYLRDFR